MMRITVEVTERLPTYWVVAVKDGESVTVKVSSATLALLREDIDRTVTGFLDNGQPGAG
jgi:hypothetical protein